MATKHTDGCFQHAEDDEPLFTLLARDPAAPGLVRQWAEKAELLGQPEEKIADALAVADQMDVWLEQRRPHKVELRKRL